LRSLQKKYTRGEANLHPKEGKIKIPPEIKKKRKRRKGKDVMGKKAKSSGFRPKCAKIEKGSGYKGTHTERSEGMPSSHRAKIKEASWRGEDEIFNREKHTGDCGGGFNLKQQSGCS